MLLSRGAGMEVDVQRRVSTYVISLATSTHLTASTGA